MLCNCSLRRDDPNDGTDDGGMYRNRYRLAEVAEMSCGKVTVALRANSH